MKASDIIRGTQQPDYPSPHSYDEFIIYGAGNNGKEIYRLLQKLNKNVIAFIDQKAAAGAAHDNVPVVTPSNEKAIAPKHKNNALVVIGIFNRDVELEPVVQMLRGFGYKNIVTFPQFHRFFSEQIGDRYWLGSTAIYSNHLEEIDEVDGLWSDEESRNIYRAFLKYRMTADHTVLPKAEGLDTQYFSRTLPQPQTPLRFVDGGAYDGDSLAVIRDMGIATEAVASFEPDLNNFRKLASFVDDSFRSYVKEAVLFPCALWSKTEYLNFSANSSEASHVTTSGGITILATSIDEVIPSFEPNYIKMDIEGAEPEALIGAKRTIESLRPNLGICVYHTPAHLWEIPLMIKSWALDYNFHLRSHGNNNFDLVLYARRR